MNKEIGCDLLSQRCQKYPYTTCSIFHPLTMVIAMFICLLVCGIFPQAEYISEMKILWNAHKASSIRVETEFGHCWSWAGGHTCLQMDRHVGTNVTSWKNVGSQTKHLLPRDNNDSKYNTIQICLQGKSLKVHMGLLGGSEERHRQRRIPLILEDTWGQVAFYDPVWC